MTRIRTTTKSYPPCVGACPGQAQVALHLGHVSKWRAVSARSTRDPRDTTPYYYFFFLPFFFLSFLSFFLLLFFLLDFFPT